MMKPHLTTDCNLLLAQSQLFEGISILIVLHPIPDQGVLLLHAHFLLFLHTGTLGGQILYSHHQYLTLSGFQEVYSGISNSDGHTGG